MPRADEDPGRGGVERGEASLPCEALLDLNSMAVAVLRGDRFRLTLANDRFTALSGLAIGDSAIDGDGFPLDREFLAAWRGDAPARVDSRPLRDGAARQFWSFDLVPLPANQASERGILIVGGDVTPIVQATESAKEQARLLDAIMTYAPAGITVASGDTVTRISAYATRLLTTSPRTMEEMALARLGEAYEVRDLATRKRVPPHELPLARASLAGEVVRGAELLITADGGRQIPIHCDAGPIRDEDGRLVGGVIVWQDIQGLKDAEAKLKHAVEAKDALLRELAHRVKNNFQMVSAMLGLQARETSDASVRDGLQQAVWRIHALANIHERLYRRDDFDGLIDLDVAITELCRNLRAAAHERVRLDLRLRPLAISADSGAPLLLLLNELVINAYKHAFPDGRAGTVTVSLRLLDPAMAELVVADDGIGLPKPIERARTLGLSLVEMMTRQIGGELLWGEGDGTTATVRFPI